MAEIQTNSQSVKKNQEVPDIDFLDEWFAGSSVKNANWSLGSKNGLPEFIVEAKLIFRI